MPTMTDAEAIAFIAAMPARTAKLATVTRDGAPQVAPIWVAVDDRDLVFTTGRDTAKGKALQRDPRVSLCFDDERPPFSFVIVRGTVTLSNDLDEMLRWATIIGGRYMGDDVADSYGRRNAVPEELLVRVTVAKFIAVSNVAD